MPVLPGNFDCIRINVSGDLDDLNNIEHVGYGIAPAPNKKTKFETFDPTHPAHFRSIQDLKSEVFSQPSTPPRPLLGHCPIKKRRFQGGSPITNLARYQEIWRQSSCDHHIVSKQQSFALEPFGILHWRPDFLEVTSSAQKYFTFLRNKIHKNISPQVPRPSAGPAANAPWVLSHTRSTATEKRQEGEEDDEDGDEDGGDCVDGGDEDGDGDSL